MKLRNTLLTAFLLIAVSLFAQEKAIYKCICPKNEMGITQDQFQNNYQLSNGRQLGIFGYKDDSLVSEFILVDCETNQLLRYWSALEQCKISKHRDTLLISEQAYLPVETNNKYKFTDWLLNYFYYSNNAVSSITIINKNIRKYTTQEIKTILKDFESHSERYTEDVDLLMNRLWLATISGDKTARTYFINFDKKFTWLDGAYSEQYHDLKAKLELWDNAQ